MAGRTVKIDHYSGCRNKKLVGVKLDREAIYWLQKLANIEVEKEGELDTISRQIRNAIHMYLKYKLKDRYRMTNEEFIRSNERTGKLYNGERY